MLHKFLTIILPLTAPATLYLLWWRFSRKQPDEESRKIPWTILMIIGLVLLVISFLVLGFWDE